MIALLMVLTGRADAMTVEEISLKELVSVSDLIFDGFVEDERSGYLPDGTMVTHLQFTSVRWIKGEGSSTFVLQVYGGQVGDEVVFVPGGPVIEKGARYVIAVDKHLEARIPLAGGWQGVFQVVPGPSASEAMVDGSGGVVVQTAQGAVMVEPYLRGQPRPGQEVSITPRRGLALDERRFCDVLRSLVISQPASSTVPDTLTFGTFVPFAE